MKIALTVGLWLLILCQQSFADQVLSSIGTVILVRDQKQYQVQPRSMLMAGDRVITQGDGAVSFALDGGAFVYTAANTSIVIGEGALRVEQGQIRIITRPHHPFTVETLDGFAIVEGGVQLFGVSNQGTRLANQTGYAELRWTGQVQPGVQQASYSPTQSATVGVAQEVNLVNGQATAVDPRAAEKWNIRVAMLQQQGINNAANILAAQGSQPTTAPGQANQPPVRRDPNLDDTAANNQRGGGGNNAPTTRRRSPDAMATQYGSSGSASNFGGVSSSGGIQASGFNSSDANQGTNQGTLVNTPANLPFVNGDPFPGNINLVTANTPYILDGLKLTSAQLDSVVASASPHDRRYFSIGEGSVPTTQVSTDFATASNATPDAIKIPGFNNYVIQLEQYGLPDPAESTGTNPVGITGLLGNNPPGPTVVGATPITDERARINDGATFALGEFRLGRSGDNLEFSVRRSDQDRTIVKDNGGNDALDQVTPNADVQFTDAVDPRFFPVAPLVKVPVQNSFNPAGTNFSDLNNLRRAAATTILADQLHDVSRATGQTRFVINGKIVDIKGYQK